MSQFVKELIVFNGLIQTGVPSTVAPPTGSPVAGQAGALYSQTTGNLGILADTGSALWDLAAGAFNAAAFGVNPANSDNTAAVNALLTAWYANGNGGGTIYWPPGVIKILGQVVIPNSTGNSPSLGVQPNGKWVGASTNAFNAAGGTRLDIRYAVGREFTDGVTNSTATLTSATANFTSADVGAGLIGAGIPAGTIISSVQSSTSLTMSKAATATATGVDVIIDSPKIDTRGIGLWEITGITFLDGGTANSTPFIRTTGTTLQVHNCAFLGTGTGQACKQDAIILGGVDTTISGFPTSGFQGYGTVIKENFFNNIRTAALGRTFANNVIVRDNNIWANCGGDSTHGAIQFTPPSLAANCAGVVIDSNLIEATNYIYGIILNFAINCIITGNSIWDVNGTTLAGVLCMSGATNNFITSGTISLSTPYISDVAGQNVFLTPLSGVTSFLGTASNSNLQMRGNILINNQITSTLTTGSFNGSAFQLSLSPASNSSANFYSTFHNINTQGSVNYTGQNFAAYYQAQHTGTGSVSGMNGLNTNVIVSNATVAAGFTQATAPKAASLNFTHSGSGIVDQANCIQTNFTCNGTGTCTNAIQIWVTTPTGSSTALNGIAGVFISDQGSTGYGLIVNPQSGNKAIWSRGGPVHFDTGSTFGFLTTPVGQQTSAGNTHTVAAGSTTNVFTNTTFDGGTGTIAYTIGDIVLALKNYGLLKS